MNRKSIAGYLLQESPYKSYIVYETYLVRGGSNTSEKRAGENLVKARNFLTFLYEKNL